MENWKTYRHDENYEISDLGNFKSKKQNKLIIGDKNNWGYHRITAYSKDKKIRKFRHREVAEHFIPNPENKDYVNHKNGDKNNNSAENLEWVTHSENQKHAYDVLKRKPSTEFEVIQKDLKTGKEIAKYKNASEATRITGISSRNILTVTKGKRKHAGGFAWEQIR